MGGCNGGTLEAVSATPSAWARARAAPFLPQVEMLYEEALYTVLYRAGTMGPEQVDDEAALLGYLQQVHSMALPQAAP